jgi:hypothetical protein
LSLEKFWRWAVIMEDHLLKEQILKLITSSFANIEDSAVKFSRGSLVEFLRSSWSITSPSLEDNSLRLPKRDINKFFEINIAHGEG